MSEHPIEGLMLTAMNSIKDMVDVKYNNRRANTGIK